MRKDLTGQKFNRLTVKAFSHKDSRNKSFWHCVCDCGAATISQGYKITSGKTKSCGCYSSEQASKRRKVNMTGVRCGSLVAIKEVGSNKFGHTLWLCVCDCGGETISEVASLRSGSTTSCGCARGKTIIHGHNKRNTRSVEYNTWASMKKRCSNPNDPTFKYYGARGIMVCDRWVSSFEAFLQDMGKRPSDKHSIDRIDNNGHYSPDNCRWATNKQQQENKREPKNTIKLTLDGITHTIPEWSRITGIKETTLRTRINRGWTVARALTTKNH